MTDKLRVILSVINPRDMGIMRHEVIPLLHGLIQGLVLYIKSTAPGKRQNWKV